MSRLLSRLPVILGTTLVAWAALVLLAERGHEWPTSEGIDVIVCLDVSRSMQARDLAPDRLGRAQAEIAALAEVARGDRLGLVLFAGEARLLVPRTQDATSLAEMAAHAGPWDVPRGGTDLAAALATARDALDDRAGTGAIIVLGDGEDLGGRETATVLAALRRDGVAVHALGLGTTRGAKIPDDGAFVRGPSGREVITRLESRALEGAAAATGGVYREATAITLPALFTEHVRPRAAAAAMPTRSLGDRAAWLLLLGALLLGIDLARGADVRRRSSHRAILAVAMGGVLMLSACGRAAPIDARDAHAAFLRGNAAWADSLELEAAAADAAGAARRDLLRAALRRAEDALAAWQWAAATRMDWPQARRNVERGLLRMRALRGHGTEGGKPNPKHARDPSAEPGRDDGKKPKKDDPPKQPDLPEDPPTDPTAKIDGRALPAERVIQVLETLRLRERQKIDLRKARRTVRPPLGGRDW